MKHNFSFLLLFSLVFGSFLGAASKPNFVFVLADDASHFDVGCYGGQAYTPIMDALAKEGMRFTQCYQSSPTCSPTRHNIYTGQYPFKTGAYPNHTFAMPGTKSIVHYLKPLGYRIALSGKTHIKPEEVFPFEYLSKGTSPDFKAIEAFMTECKASDTPFCLFVTSNDPHAPWDKGDPSRYNAKEVILPYTFVDTPETRDAMTRYLAELTVFDEQVGQTLGLIDKFKLADNTLFIATTEQGSSLPFAKWTLYDAGLHTGFIARWPGMVAAGSVCDSLIEYSDIVPTFVEAAGGTPARKLDGKSLIPLLKEETTEHKDYIFSQATTRGIINAPEYFGIRSIRSEKFKYIWNFTPEVRYENVVTIEEDTKWGEAQVFNSWKKKAKYDADAAEKVRRYHYRPGEELYAVDQDPNEWRNLADVPEYSKIKNQLRAKLMQWMKHTGDKGQQSELEADLHSGKLLK